MKSRAVKSLSDALFETNYQSKVASELWLNLGGKEYRLVGRKIRLGRAADNDIVLEHRSCSRYHALIRIEGGRVIFEDLKSRNGVRVNGHKISRVEIKDNAEIQVGDLQGIFYQRTRDPQKANKEVTSAGQSESEIVQTAGEPEKDPFQRIKNLPKPIKLLSVGAMPLVVFGLLLMIHGSPAPSQGVEESNLFRFDLTESDIIEAALERSRFESCREAEDLGNFRRARTCLESLPLTNEVFHALKRVVQRQYDLSQQRFMEGQRALQNKYYDLAILKLQEVLLIADDSSELRQKIPRMIQEAKEGKRLL